MSFNTKLFFDEELNSTLLEGGGNRVSKRSRGGSSEVSSSRKGKQKPQPVADEEQDGFIRKTYGLFSVAVLVQLIYVVAISKNKDLATFASNITLMAVATVLHIVAIAVVVMKKNSNETVGTGLGYACWTLQTIGLTYTMGFAAAKKDPNVMIAGECGALVLAVVCTALGPKILKTTGGDKALKKMGSGFLVLSIILATVLVVATTLGVGGMGNALILGLVLVLMVAFFMADTHLILNGQYGPMNKDDYIFASMKLFADFILILTIVMQLFE